MATPKSRAEARELVRKITKDHGFVSPEKFEKLESFDPELRRVFEEALLAKDIKIGSSVLTLATNLYTSKARFIFELIQNADDNSYSKAKGSGDTPYLSFHVHPDCIVVECNEDGFTDKNLTAICDIGKSSKTEAQGYIGEKGIGFKSVFMAAWKVHIQSGVFSFSFKHKKGDSGMGMISPLWEETSEELPSPLTRFTLYLRSDGDAEVLARIIESIKTQFEELQETLLLFMKNLGRIDVILHDEASRQISTTTYSIERPSPTYAVLKKTRTAGGVTKESVKHFHVTTHMATGLPKNENRTYSDTEERTQAYARSQVVLAFPLSESQDPIGDEPQFLFVFLPVRPVGFDFLIQADFVTDANRQDVVQDSPRNARLIGSVADAFIKAISQFCDHDKLRYTWMRYLPNKKSKEWSGLWSSLVKTIASRLRDGEEVLYGRDDPSRRSISDLYRLGDSLLDEHGEPLFEDTKPGKTISPHYSESDLDTLMEYGLEWAGWAQFTEWVEEDLKRDKTSRMRSSSTSEKWHTKVAQILNKGLKTKQGLVVPYIKRLKIIPLEDGDWVSGGQVSVYFPRINELEVPSNIDLPLVAKSVVNTERIALFRNLGVKEASISLVRKSILRFHKGKDPDLATSKCHLEFLYLSEDDGTRDESYDDLKLHNQNGDITTPATAYVYIVNDDPHGPWELFRETEPGPNPGDGAPGYLAEFLHAEYFHDPPDDTQNWTWIGWLHDKLGVEKYVDLQHDEFREYIGEERPEKFLGAIYVYHWYHSRLMPRLIELLRSTAILCRGNREVLLKEAYFPTADLVERTGKYFGEDVFFPWLQVEFETPSIIPPRWKTLLGVLEIPVSHNDIDFALSMLNYFLQDFPSNPTGPEITRLFELYDHIQERYWTSEAREDAKQKIRAVFLGKRCIYIPLSESDYKWALPDECVWEAPKKMRTKFVLKRLYGNCFCRDGTDCIHFTKFFVETLGISAACTWQDYIEELKALKDEYEDADTIMSIYTAINTLQPKGTDSTCIRDAFERDALIYAMVDDRSPWYKPSQCVWSKAIRLRGAVSISEAYEDLEDLFLLVLGVKQANLLMTIDELKQTGSRQPVSVPEVKESIWTVNSLLPTEMSPPASSEIVKSAIFPIRYPDGGVTCGTETTEFFIPDREYLKECFADKVKLLDFTLEEVGRLRPFLHWTGLQGRYLSSCAEEVTSFPGDVVTPESNLSLEIRQRAHPFLRIACQFNSPRSNASRDVQYLYEALKNARIFGTNGISSIIKVFQDGKYHQVESSRTTLHLDEHDSRLSIYVPCDKDNQQYMFRSRLPEKLFTWMITDPVTQKYGSVEKDGVNATKDILLTPYTKLTEALEDHGIGNIDVENTDEMPPESEPSLTAVSISAGLQNLDIGDSSDGDGTEYGEGLTPASGAESVRFYYNGATASNVARSSRGGTITYGSSNLSPSFELPTPTRHSTNHRYVRTLGRVIAAGRRDSLPVHSETNNGRQSSSWYDLGLRDMSRFERDCKVGAAGELYVFELLSNLSGNGLRGFSRDNWQSNMRNYVTSHPEYDDMAEWHGPETSDIVYEDVQSTLTGELIEKEYLTRDSWEGQKPSYFIEVKSTTSSCDAPFYMSKGQYERMQDNTNRATNNKATIYAIFRVYWVGQENMGLEIYLDPESLRRSGRLKFEGEVWSVVPGTGQNGV